MQCQSVLALVHILLHTFCQAADETVEPNYQYEEINFFHYLIVIVHKKLPFLRMQITQILLLPQLLHSSILSELIISKCKSDTLWSYLKQLMLYAVAINHSSWHISDSSSF